MRVEQGRMLGVETDGARAFKGVPFAAPPLGDLRFRPPEPPAPWLGLRDASSFAPAPLQPAAPGALSYRDFLGADVSEDCLYLNVWQPAKPGPHPVLVWIHGGGNIAGAASQSIDGSTFARRGIVCVTIGYRLGAFGFLELGELLGPDYRGSGVNGLRDQIAALQWIQRNIAAFGGDPRRVTIGGVSAGAKNVVTLMASPLAHGLFSSAIVESGGQTVYNLCSANHVAREFADLVPAARTDPAALLTAPAAQLNAQQMPLLARHSRPYPFRAIVGTDVVPMEPIAALAERANASRLLIGTNRDEAIVMVDRAKAETPLTIRQLSNVTVNDAQWVAARYADSLSDLTLLERRVRLLSAEEYLVPSLRVADAMRRQGGDTWLYRFEQEAPSGPFEGWVPHPSEAMYVWQAFDDPMLAATFGKVGEEGRALGREMTARWAAFVHGDSPDLAGGVSWPAYDGSALLEFAQGASRTGQVHSEEIDLWRSTPFDAEAVSACAA